MNKLVKLLKAVGIAILVLVVLAGLLIGISAVINWLFSINPCFVFIPIAVIVFAFLVMAAYTSIK